MLWGKYLLDAVLLKSYDKFKTYRTVEQRRLRWACASAFAQSIDGGEDLDKSGYVSMGV